MRIKQDYMEFSFASNTVSFGATAKKIVVDWGDGTTNKYADIIDDSIISQTYPNSAIRTVKIQEEELTYLYCSGNQLTSTVLDYDDNPLISLDISGEKIRIKIINKTAESEKPLTE
jgi:hypothetical protein